MRSSMAMRWDQEKGQEGNWNVGQEALTKVEGDVRKRQRT